MTQESVMTHRVKITAVRQTVYEDLMKRYENPIEHTCDGRSGLDIGRRTVS